jgi:hypothetical protein
MPVVLPDTPTVEAAIVEMTNAFRTQEKLGRVTANAALTEAARAYAALLARSGQFSHTADGRQAGDRIASAGYQWCEVGENLALHIDSRGFQSRDLARKSVDGWIHSPPHRKNLVAPFVTEIGVGVASAPGPDPKFISVQLFARPKALEYAFEVANTTAQVVSYDFGGKTREVKPRFIVTHRTCDPGDISFVAFGGRTLSMRYPARDGLVYRLVPDAASGVRVEVKPIEHVR